MSQLARQQQDPSTTRRANVNLRNALTHEEIERHAYMIYLSRGGEEGHDLEDWLQAEAELKAKGPGLMRA